MPFVRIRQPMDFCLPSQRRQCDHTVIQRRTAAQHQVSSVRIGMRQVHIGIGIQMQAALAHPPPPWL